MFKVISASAAGKAHIRIGRGCDDAFSWSVKDGRALFAVADGAGSRKFSALGAHAAVKSVKEEFENHVLSANSESMRELFETALSAINELAQEVPIEIKKKLWANGHPYATTFAVILIDQEQCVIGQIGDSLVFTYSCNDEIATVAPENSGEYSNETTFITSPNALDDIRVETSPASSIQGFLMSTDGMRFQILEVLKDKEPFRPFFEDIFAYLGSDKATSESLERFLCEVEDQSFDDKTILAAIRFNVSESSGLSEMPEPILFEEGLALNSKELNLK